MKIYLNIEYPDGSSMEKEEEFPSVPNVGDSLCYEDDEGLDKYVDVKSVMWSQGGDSIWSPLINCVQEAE